MSRSLLFLMLTSLSGICAANDFPTQARVEFVLGCMNEHGGQSYDTLYPCVCLIDRIAESMSYAEFSEAQVFSQLRSTAGERGGIFRDPEQAESLPEKLEAALEQGDSQCFIGRRRTGTAASPSADSSEDSSPGAPENGAPGSPPAEPASQPAEPPSEPAEPNTR